MEINASSTSFDQRLRILGSIFANMKTRSQGTGKSGIMLAGDPGVGKTSFIRFFSTLTGIELITIEAPHITEEHIVNIPFIVYDPVSKREEPGSTDFDTSDFKVVLSDSNLYSKLKAIKKLPDAQYLKAIYRAPADVIKIFEELGGDKNTIPDDIAEIRESFKVILFLDEYFRQTSLKIRNMLRGILNNKIGSHDLPPDTFVIYASNLNDEGVEDNPTNADFHQIDFEAPNKDEWFAWLVAKFEKDERVKLDQKIVKKFYDLLNEEDLNHEDMDKLVRTSPRRWEQILLYVNSSLPAENEKEAKSLLTNIKAGFKNYLTGEKSEIANKVLDAVAELIKETSKIEISATAENTSEEWKDTLEHQIRQKMKLGEHRKYIPIVAGAPGIGKTTHAIKIAKDLDLRYIYIDCSNLSPEDVVGLPLPKGGNKKKIETHFSEPALYHQILRDCEEADKDHIEHLKSKLKGDEQKKAIEDYKTKEYKYLIFFDELNRNTSKVFNGIRRVLLEKSFGGGYDLPKGSVVISAINPYDNGANELTSHMRDVVDVIDAKADFEQTKKYLQNMPFPSIKNAQAKDVVYDILIKFSEKFRVKHTTEEISNKQRPFYLDVGAGTLYISPREYSDMFSMAVLEFDQNLTRALKRKNVADMDNDQIAETEIKLRTGLFESFKNKLSNILTKHQVRVPEFLADLKDWFIHSRDFEFGEGLYYTKAKTVSIESILGDFFQNPSDSNHLADDVDFVGFIQNHDPHKFKEELAAFLVAQFEKDEDVAEKLINKKHKSKTVKNGQIEFEDEEVSKFEHLIREMVNAIEIHKLSGEHREIIRLAVREALLHIKNKHGANYIDELLEFNGKIHHLIKGLKK